MPRAQDLAPYFPREAFGLFVAFERFAGFRKRHVIGGQQPIFGLLEGQVGEEEEGDERDGQAYTSVSATARSGERGGTLTLRR